tara:strand:- start:668 stop:2686 length:2019 start_codon:yes stop_codon:yes gene_type:complete
MLRNNTRDRSTINMLNDRQNFLKVIKSREFNLERQKELKKLLAEQTNKLASLQNQKVKKLKQGRGKNLRGELVRNKNLQRRFERGERRYDETQEPRIVGDPAPVVVGGVAPEDKEVAMARLQLQDRKQTQELAIQRGVAQGNLINTQESNRLRALEIQNDRDIRVEEQALTRLKLEAERDNIPIPEFNIGNHQFFGNLLTGLSQDRHRERDATQNIIKQFQDHQERLAGGLSQDILNQLFNRAQASGLRVEGHQAPTGPNPNPPSVIELPDRIGIETVANSVRSILRTRPTTENRSIEGTQTHGALTELELELATPASIPSMNNVQSFLEGATGDAPELDPDDASSITFSEFDRRVNKAEADLDQTSEGIARALEAERFNQENPFALVIDNPINEINLTPSETSNLRKETDKTTEKELIELKKLGITTDRLSQLSESIEQDEIKVGEAEQQIEEGAGVGVLEQVGQGLVQVAGGVVDAGLGVIQGAGQAIIDQLPTPNQTGQAIGRGAVAAGGALLQGAGGIIQAVAGEGRFEEVIEDIPDIVPTDEGELLEEIPISMQNTAQISDNSFDYAEFTNHHGTEASRRGPPTLAQRAQAPQYSIQNTSDRMHKKLSPGQRVDITSYGADKKGDTIGYFGAGAGVSAGDGKRRETKLKLDILNNSIDKGFLKLHKN